MRIFLKKLVLRLFYGDYYLERLDKSYYKLPINVIIWVIINLIIMLIWSENIVHVVMVGVIIVTGSLVFTLLAILVETHTPDWRYLSFYQKWYHGKTHVITGIKYDEWLLIDKTIKIKAK